MQVSDAQGNVQAELFKSNAVSNENLASVVTEVCRWFAERFGAFEVGNLEESVVATVRELVDTAIGEGEDGLIHAVSLALALKSFFQHCSVFSDYLRNKLANAVDNALTTKDRERSVLRVPPEVISRAVALVPSLEELEDVVIKSVKLSIAKPLTIADLRELAKEGRVAVVFDSRRHRYQITIKIKDLFTNTDAEVIITLSNEKVNTVLKYGYKTDKKPRKGEGRGGTEEGEKEEESNRLFDLVPRILEPYASLFLKHGWIPAFSSIEFVKFMLEIEEKDRSAFNTTRDELRTILLNALKKFKFTTVSYKDGTRLYDPLFVTNLKEYVYIDEDNKELIVPSRFFAEIETRSGYKSALVNLLLKEGLLKTKHATYTFARKDKTDDKTTLNVAIFYLNKLAELLGFDPKDLMREEGLDISKLLELKENEAGGDGDAVGQ